MLINYSYMQQIINIINNICDEDPLSIRINTLDNVEILSIYCESHHGSFSILIKKHLQENVEQDTTEESIYGLTNTKTFSKIIRSCIGPISICTENNLVKLSCGNICKTFAHSDDPIMHRHEQDVGSISTLYTLEPSFVIDLERYIAKPKNNTENNSGNIIFIKDNYLYNIDSSQCSKVAFRENNDSGNMPDNRIEIYRKIFPVLSNFSRLFYDVREGRNQIVLNNNEIKIVRTNVTELADIDHINAYLSIKRINFSTSIPTWQNLEHCIEEYEEMLSFNVLKSECTNQLSFMLLENKDVIGDMEVKTNEEENNLEINISHQSESGTNEVKFSCSGNIESPLFFRVPIWYLYEHIKATPTESANISIKKHSEENKIIWEVKSTEENGTINRVGIFTGVNNDHPENR